MEKQLNEWKQQTDRFKAGAEKLEAGARAQFDRNLEVLRAKQAEAWEHFQNLKTVNESAWTHFKTYVDAAGAEVKTAVDGMLKTFKS
jgi:hypothetical protein